MLTGGRGRCQVAAATDEEGGMGDAPWAVPLSDVLVDEGLLEAAVAAVRSGWWSMGPRVQDFERSFAELCDVRHAVAVSSGTAALHLALIGIGCGPGDEVILPSLNFVAAANVILHAGATPVFCDVHGPDDLTLDPADLEAAVTPATKAIIVMHYGGFPCAMDQVAAIAERHGLMVVEDAAHAPGGRFGMEMLGGIGRTGCFSFFSNKNLPIGEGGMVVTDDDELATQVRLLRSHGMTTLTWDRHRGHSHTYEVLRAGFNYRMDETRAALGLTQLSRLDDMNRARADLVDEYRGLLHGVGGIVMPFVDCDGRGRSAHHLAVVVLPPGVDRTAVRETLASRRIQTSVHYPPIHTFTAHSSGARADRLPQTDDLADRIMTLPLYPHLESFQVRLVAAELLNAVAAGVA
jgi:dTDP-4-amino-4,6-dideoxygalactose transaminase